MGIAHGLLSVLDQFCLQRHEAEKAYKHLVMCPCTSMNIYDQKVLSEVEQNFIQWSQINREPVYKKQRSDNYGSRYSDSKKDSSQSRYQNAAFQSFRPQSKQGDQNKRQSSGYSSNRGSAPEGRGRRK